MSKSVSSYKLQNNEVDLCKPNLRVNYIPQKCSHSHTQLDSDCQSAKQNLTQRPIKYPFLKKNSRESLASSLSKKPKQKNQQNSKNKNITNPTNNKESNKAISLNRMNNFKNNQNNFSSGTQVQKNKNTKQLSKLYDTQKQKYAKSQNESVEQGNDTLYRAIQQNGLLCPPSSLNSIRLTNIQSQRSSGAKIQSFSNYIRQNPCTIKHFEKQDTVRPNSNQFAQFNNNIQTTANHNSTHISFLTKQQIQICPQLFYLYRSQNLQQQINLQIMSMRMYSKGRKQIKYRNGIIQVYFNNGSDIKLTKWPNGDFKLKDNSKVSYWNEQMGELDQYFLD